MATERRQELNQPSTSSVGKLPASSAASELTEREQEVLQAIARGERSKEIAYRLGISERTVKAHLSSIYSKLGVDSRAAAIAVAAQHGLLGDTLDPTRFNDAVE